MSAIFLTSFSLEAEKIFPFASLITQLKSSKSAVTFSISDSMLFTRTNAEVSARTAARFFISNSGYRLFISTILEHATPPEIKVVPLAFDLLSTLSDLLHAENWQAAPIDKQRTVMRDRVISLLGPFSKIAEEYLQNMYPDIPPQSIDSLMSC